MAENVRDYGASGNGRADDTQAINAAADAAGPGGEVYFPSGTYLVGSSDRIPMRSPGDGSWDDITWSGENANDTTVLLAGGQTRAHFVFQVLGNSVTFQDLTIDGNKDQQQNGNAGLCILTEGTGQFTMRNCRLRKAQNAALKHSGRMNSLIENCDFFNSGYPSNGGHAISPNQKGDYKTTIRRCGFIDQKGADIDVGVGQDSGTYPPQQTVVVKDCYARGSYRGFMKFSDSNKDTLMERCAMYGNADTEIPVKANPGTADIGNVTLVDCVIDGSKFPGIDLPRPGNLTLDNVKLVNVGRGGHRNGAGIYSDKINIDGGTVSIHGTDRLVELTGSSRGRIDEIIHEGQPLGRDNNIVASTRQGSPLNPDVPTESEVGPYATDGGGGGGGGGGTPTKSLVVRGTGVATNYRITVDGSIMADSDVEAWDVIDGGSVQGWVTETSDVDNFLITGEVTNVEMLQGDAIVTVDGEEIETGGNGDNGGETPLPPQTSGISPGAALGLVAVGVGLAIARDRGEI